MTIEASADWCVTDGGMSICGTNMREASRESQGIKWCFTCRKRHEFWWVVKVPNGMSYYGPSAHMDGIHSNCRDLFPGWFRRHPEDDGDDW